MSAPADKPALRTGVLAARRSMSQPVRAAADRALAAAVRRLVRPGARVAAYTPLATEPGGTELLPALAAVAGAVLLPVLRPDRDLDWSLDGTPLGLPAIATADLIVVPALAVDRTGVRLGRGGGSYDRALHRVAASTPVVALLYEGEFRADPLPAEPHDRRVTAVLTPAGTHRTASWVTSDGSE